MPEAERRLAAIMFTDMVGFTGLTQSDEAHALAVLQRHNELLRPVFSRFRGREVKAVGDSFLVEFDSALEAVECAFDVQRRVEEYSAGVEERWRFQIRIGIHLGDVLHAGGDVLGDAVNLAARIEPLAEPGGVCVSEQVFAQVRNKVTAAFERLPPTELKNVRYPTELYRVQRSSGDGPGPHAEGAAPRIRRLAVLPFANMSPDPEDEYFAEGLTEEMITTLARLPGLEVIARTSVMRYRGAPKGIRDVGRELRVDVALEGSVRKAARRIRVTAQLIDAKSEAHIWAESFDRELTEVFALQSEIAARVAEALKVQLGRDVGRPPGKAPTRNLAAYEQYLQGRHYWWEAGEENYRAAIRHFSKALELDGDFALAYCGLADSHALLGNHGYVPLEAALRSAEGAARRALELDPGLADAHVSYAPILFNRYDWAGAESELRRAVALDPNSVLAHFWLATVLGTRGHLAEGLEESKKAAALDPLSRQAVIGSAMFLYYMRDFQGSLDHLDAAEREAGFRSEYFQARNRLQLGHATQALEQAQRAMSGPTANNPSRRAILAIALGRAGREEESAEIFGRLLQEAEAGKVPAGLVALVYAAQGQNDRAFEWFDRAYRERSAAVVDELLVDPLLDGLRTDPRYPALLAKFHYES